MNADEDYAPAVIDSLPENQALFPGIRLSVLRLDQMHPLWGGNKFFKLRHTLQRARAQNRQLLLSIGGAWSNHLHALAALCHANGLRSIGIVRGDESRALSATLQDAQSWGMQLHQVSREQFRYLRTPAGLADLGSRFPDALIVPEGGDNEDGLKGCRDLGEQLQCRVETIDTVVLGVGTGTTLAGLALGLAGYGGRLIGVLAARDLDRVRQNIHTRCGGLTDAVDLTDRFAAPGFGRLDPALIRFWNAFEQSFRIELDPIYTLKAAHAISCLAHQGAFRDAERVLMIHTGGVQGKRGFENAPCAYNAAQTSGSLRV